MVELYVCDSLRKVNKEEKIPSLKSFSMLKNEKYSFQVVIKASLGLRKLKLNIKGIDNKYVSIFQEKKVYTNFIYNENNPVDDYFISKTSGAYYDVLSPLDQSGVVTYTDDISVYFVSIHNSDGFEHSKYDLTIELSNEEEILSTYDIQMNVVNSSLEETSLLVTNWFHYDSLAEYYHLKVFSSSFYKVLDPYVKNYVSHGNNMILTPLFTPCLDTKVGSERMTVQLVEVILTDEGYKFDFSKLDYFINFMLERKIKYFEMSHLFTQWGAKACPKIEVIIDGKKVKKFGWSTSSLSNEYREFLSVFLKELDIYLKDKGIHQNCYFHISDEPFESSVELYKEHKQFLSKYLSDYQLFDALSDIKYADIIDLPVVALDHTEDFINNNKQMMVYYCCGQVVKNVPNRFINMPSLRNRILGFLMFLNDAKGFLQWGHNYYYNFLSESLINPYIECDSGGRFSPGDAYVVYPGHDYKPINSLRHEVFYEGIQDYMLCDLVGKIKGKETVKAILKKYGLHNYDTYPHNEEELFKMRSELHELLREM